MTQDEKVTEEQIIRQNFNPNEYGCIKKIAAMIGRSNTYVSYKCKEYGLKHINGGHREETYAKQLEYGRRWRQMQKEGVFSVRDTRKRLPVLMGWFPGIGAPCTAYQKMLAECII